MKKLVAMWAILWLLWTLGVFAGDEYYEKQEAPKAMEDREVIYYDFDLELEVEDGIVEAEWEEFEGEWFDWYKLVYSTTNSMPVYPSDKTVFVGDEDQTEAEFKLKSGYDYHYVRICAVILNDDYSKDRYCGETQKLEWDGEYTDKYEEKDEKYKSDDIQMCTIEYAPVCGKKDGKQKTYGNKCGMNAAKAQYLYSGECREKVEETWLSETMKQRVDERIETFVETLESRDLSDSEMVRTLEIVKNRLAKYKNVSKYKALIRYMYIVLDEYINEYDDPIGELEDIFKDL